MDKDMTLTEVVKLEGVKDLPTMTIRGRFAQALIAEAKGDSVLAEQKLNEACKLEEEHYSNLKK